MNTEIYTGHQLSRDLGMLIMTNVVTNSLGPYHDILAEIVLKFFWLPP